MSADGHLKADLLWSQVFRSFVTSGALASLQGSAVKVYIALKSRANLDTGEAKIQHEQLARETGLSVATVKRGLRELANAGYLCSEERPGQCSRYLLFEQIPLSRGGQQIGTARFLYTGSSAQIRREQLKRLIDHGKVDGTAEIHSSIRIELTVNNITINNIVDYSDVSYPSARSRAVIESHLRRTGNLSEPIHSQLTDDLAHQ
ncbi:helix-turn-helix domain-containing protein [Pseudomonas sp. SH1-B]